MNYKMIIHTLGRIFLVEAALLAIPMLVGILYGESNAAAFLIPMGLLLVIGAATGIRAPKNTAIYAKEGLVIVAMAWILMSLFGAMPFVISGEIPRFVDAFFETVSGFTTTGASILPNVELLSQAMLFWRSFTHWVGGMGVLVFVMAVLPTTDGRAMHLMRAEVPGPTVGKLSSKLRDTAKILYGIYLLLTVTEVVLLLLGGMPLYDALIHSFGSAGTGGFSNKALSVGAYDSVYAEVVISVFMLLFGVKFNLYFLLLCRRFREALLSEELIAYLCVVGTAIVAITWNLTSLMYSFGTSLRYALFQVSSIITTTGYATTDFSSWPELSRAIMVLLMFFGACAGSTGGGLKIARVVILLKTAVQDVRHMIHPHAVSVVRFEKKPLDEKTFRSVHVYFVLYILLFAVSVLLLSLEHFDLITTFTAVASCLNNIGPGLELVGPMGNYSGFSDWGKLLLCWNMLLGRLEIYPILTMMVPLAWRRNRKKR